MSSQRRRRRHNIQTTQAARYNAIATHGAPQLLERWRVTDRNMHVEEDGAMPTASYVQHNASIANAERPEKECLHELGSSRRPATDHIPADWRAQKPDWNPSLPVG